MRAFEFGVNGCAVYRRNADTHHQNQYENNNVIHLLKFLKHALWSPVPEAVSPGLPIQAYNDYSKKFDTAYR